MKIAIFNGSLKPTTFVLRLAQAVSEEHTVFMTGASNKLFRFKKHNIHYIPTHSNRKLVLVFQAFFQLVRFFIVHPKRCSYFIKILKASNKPIKTKCAQLLIWSKLISNKVDVVHIQWASHIFLFEELLDDAFFKTMVSLRGRLINITPLADSELKALYLDTFPKVNQFHAVTHDIKRQAMIYGASEDKIKVIYSGVELKTFDPFQKQEFSKGDTLRILSVGREHWKKGYNYALEALKEVLEKGIHAEYKIIGASGAEEIIYSIQDLQLNNDVTLTGKLDYQNVLKEMQNADVLLLPSVSEGLANVVIEAMALGLPVISTNAVGMSELVIHKETGLLFENRNVNDLAKQIINFNSMSTSDVEIMSRNAKQKVIAQHNWKTFKRSFNEFYNC